MFNTRVIYTENGVNYCAILKGDLSPSQVEQAMLSRRVGRSQVKSVEKIRVITR